MSDISAEDEAARWRERLLLDPRDIGAMLRLAALHEASGELPQAIELAQRALRVDPEQKTALFLLGTLWAALGDSVRAAERFERLLALDPDDRLGAAAALAALPPAGSPTEQYVRTLFDQYAPRFETALALLDYRGPALVAACMEATLGPPAGALDLLDLGCGTGLSGAALHPWAKRLDGVDLSPRMVDRAAERGLYATLSVDEAVRFLDRAEMRWDAIVAVDMLNYLADLGPVFVAAAGRSDQLFGTIERSEGDEVELRATRRYAHSDAHLVDAAAASGWMLKTRTLATLRREGGREVEGIVFALTRLR